MAPVEAKNRGVSGLTLLMAIGCSVSIANIYYCQPLLAQLSKEVQGAARLAAYVPMFTQLGTMFGMAFIVPLGDMFERRRLIVTVSLALAAADVSVAVAPTGSWLAAASLLLGCTAVVPHLILPFAAQLAAPEERGKIVGTVFSGLLIGVLGGRTFSGMLSASFGWRSVYVAGSCAVAVLALLLARRLPQSRPSVLLTYAQLLRSLLGFFRTSSTLRRAALTGAMLFGAFSAFWSTLIFRLSTPPLHYGSRAAGLFGLVGLAGAAAAPVIGRIADRRGPRATVQVALFVTAASFVVFLFTGHTLPGLICGVILMDLGVQSGQVSNQTLVYGLQPEARSRLNTIYMTSYFLGGALGSAAAASAWRIAGWAGVCSVGLSFMGIALAVGRLPTRRS